MDARLGVARYETGAHELRELTDRTTPPPAPPPLLHKYACRSMPAAFVRELLEKMPRGDVAGVDRISRWTPLGHAFRENPDRESVVRLLVLWGCAVRADDFPSRTWKGGDLEGSRRRCLLWALDLLVARHTFLTIVLGCGVHASRPRTRGRWKASDFDSIMPSFSCRLGSSKPDA